MKITACKDSIAQVAAEAVVVGVFAGEKGSKPSLIGPAVDADKATGGLLAKLIESEDICGKRFELTPLLAPAGIKAGQLLVVGLGEREKFDVGTAFRATAAAARQLAGKKRAKVAFFLGSSTAELTEAAVAGAIVGCQGQDIYRAEKKRNPFEEILIAGGDENAIASGQDCRREHESDAAAGERAGAGDLSGIVCGAGGGGGEGMWTGVRDLGSGAVGEGKVRFAVGGGQRIVAAGAAGDFAVSRREERCGALGAGGQGSDV